jgi:putative ABC transport system permease protein
MQLALDDARLPELYRAVKDTPAISGAISQRAALASMRRMLEQNLQIALVNLLVAAMLVLGLVYNNARISLSERLTELAGMRLLGYSRLDAAYVLAGEVWLLALLALPLGALLGWGAAFAMTEGTANELFRLPLHIQARSFAVAVLVIAAAVLASIVVVTRPLYRADIVSLLQSRG